MDLGYENHVIVALDNASYRNIIVQGNYRCEKTADYLQAVGFKSIVKLRLTTIAQYLEKGQNVFVSDVDTYYNFYFDLNQLPPNYDVFRAYTTTWSPAVLEKWGFTLCTCIAGYRANSKTIQLFREIIKRCGEKCSDQ